jgi:archaeal flagellar protein FlaJ
MKESFFKKSDFSGAFLGLAIIVLSRLLLDLKLFPLFLGIGVVISFLPFVFRVISENKHSDEKEEMFLEFSRNLVESVKTGTPISKSIINLATKDYGSLTPHVRKLANQISLGIPINHSLKVFSKEVNNKSISRALTLIGQAERAGGDIGEILEAVAEAVSLVDKLKKERRAAISNLVVQGYVIFIIFIIIILIMQFQIIPMVSGIGSLEDVGLGIDISKTDADVEQKEISNAFLYLIMTQGLFAGLVIGKLSEGKIKAGIKHSFSLMVLSYLISTLAEVIFV